MGEVFGSVDILRCKLIKLSTGFSYGQQIISCSCSNPHNVGKLDRSNTSMMMCGQSLANLHLPVWFVRCTTHSSSRSSNAQHGKPYATNSREENFTKIERIFACEIHVEECTEGAKERKLNDDCNTDGGFAFAYLQQSLDFWWLATGQSSDALIHHNYCVSSLN